MKKLWLKIKLLFNGVITKIIDFIIANDKIVTDIAPVAVNVCNFLKEYNDDGTINIVASLLNKLGISGTIASTLIIKWLTDENLDKISTFFNILDKTAEQTSLVGKVTVITNYIKGLETSSKVIAWANLSALITESLSDGKLSFSEIKAITDMIYQTKANL